MQIIMAKKQRHFYVRASERLGTIFFTDKFVKPPKKYATCNYMLFKGYQRLYD